MYVQKKKNIIRPDTFPVPGHVTCPELSCVKVGLKLPIYLVQAGPWKGKAYFLFCHHKDVLSTICQS